MGSATSVSIAAEDYCAFLNQNAASDPFHFYDEKMAAGSGSACIVRYGAVDSYQYQPVRYRLQAAGAEKKPSSPITFLSCNDALQYCAWKNKNAAQPSSL